MSLDQRWLEPIRDEPLHFRPPFDQPDSRLERRVDEDARDHDRRVRVERMDTLTAALTGVSLSAYERRVLLWLTTWEPGVVAVVASLLHRNRAAGESTAAAVAATPARVARLGAMTPDEATSVVLAALAQHYVTVRSVDSRVAGRRLETAIHPHPATRVAVLAALRAEGLAVVVDEDGLVLVDHGLLDSARPHLLSSDCWCLPDPVRAADVAAQDPGRVQHHGTTSYTVWVPESAPLARGLFARGGHRG